MPRRKKEDELPPDQKGPPRGAANARERTRMRVLSKAFGRLKLTLPWVPPDTKLSKLDTLRLATSYISHLQVLLESEEDDIETSDNDNDRDIKIDSSVRTRQLTSLRCWPYGQRRLTSTTPNCTVTQPGLTKSNEISNNSISVINSALVSSSSLKKSSTETAKANASKLEDISGVKNAIEISPALNKFSNISRTRASFTCSNEKLPTIQTDKSIVKDCRFGKNEKNRQEENVVDGNHRSDLPMNNNISRRFFQHQQGEESFQAASSVHRGNVDDCSLPSSNYLAPKDHMENYDYPSMMYRQNVHEVKYRNDYNSAATNRLQYY